MRWTALAAAASTAHAVCSAATLAARPHSAPSADEASSFRTAHYDALGVSELRTIARAAPLAQRPRAAGQTALLTTDKRPSCSSALASAILPTVRNQLGSRSDLLGAPAAPGWYRALAWSVHSVTAT